MCRILYSRLNGYFVYYQHNQDKLNISNYLECNQTFVFEHKCVLLFEKFGVQLSKMMEDYRLLASIVPFYNQTFNTL